MMGGRLRPIAILIVLFSLSHGVYASGVSEQAWNYWFDDFADFLGITDPANTGLTVFPTLQIPMGGEYEALGTAYTGAARDVSFLEANPAASADLELTELSVFHNNLIADTSMESFAYTTRFEHFGAAVGGKYLHVPFTEYDDFGVQQGSSRFSEVVVAANASYNFFNSFNFNGLAVGGNLKFAYRNIPEIIVANQSAAGIMLDAGLLSRFNALKFYSSRSPNLSVGTVVRNLGPNVRGEPLPTVWSSGIGWQPFRPVLITADLNLPFNLFSNAPAEALAYAFGTAVTVTDFFTIRSGLLIRGGNPRISLGGSVLFDQITLTVNYTLDMTTQLTAFDRFSMQARFSLGDRGRANREERVRVLYLDALEAFAVGNLESAIELAGDALEIDPTFEPASETLQMATRMQELQGQMESIQLGEDLETGESTTTPLSPDGE